MSKKSRTVIVEKDFDGTEIVLLVTKLKSTQHVTKTITLFIILKI